MTLGVSYETLYIAVGGWMSRRFEQIESWWGREATRHFLWLPACLGAGIALYYALPWEPPIPLLPLIAAAFSSIFIACRRRLSPLWRGLAIGLLVLLVGAAYANIRAHGNAPTSLRESLTPRPMLGVVRDIERTEHGVRLTLTKAVIEDLAPALTPSQIRLSVRLKKGSEFTLPNIGDTVAIRAGLMAPMGPVLPHGFDFARYFSFRDIGAVGYGLPPWKVVEADPSGSRANQFWSWRAKLTDDIVRTLGTPTGGIAAGLITGDGRAISEDDFDALRASNLYHIIAISGEHMMIISGVIFISLRLLLLLLPKRIALRPEGKSIVAIISLMLVTVYLFVTGLPISAVRAYVMIALVLMAIILRKQVDPMRSLAFTALLILLVDPPSLLDPGFQLSFAATLALVALVEKRLMAALPMLERGKLRGGFHHLITLLLASVVAEAATTPLVISMFNNLSLYGVFANAVATPLVSLFLMPTVALFFILLPLGLHGWALALLNYGIKALLALAHFVAGLPYAQWFVPSLPSFGLALFVLGLLWLCLWQTRARRYGAIAILIGVASVFTVTLPDMLVSGSLKQIAFRTDNGYVLARGRATSLVPELWANGLGYKTLAAADTPQWRCDGLGCVAQVKGLNIAFPNDATALLEDCAQANIIITATRVDACRKDVHVVDPGQHSQSNVTALWLNKKGVARMETSRDWQGQRPWSIVNSDTNEDD